MSSRGAPEGAEKVRRKTRPGFSPADSPPRRSACGVRWCERRGRAQLAFQHASVVVDVMVREVWLLRTPFAEMVRRGSKAWTTCSMCPVPRHHDELADVEAALRSAPPSSGSAQSTTMCSRLCSSRLCRSSTPHISHVENVVLARPVRGGGRARVLVDADALGPCPRRRGAVEHLQETAEPS